MSVVTDKDLKEKGIQAIKDALKKDKQVVFDDLTLIQLEDFEKDEFYLSEEDLNKSFERAEKDYKEGKLKPITDIDKFVDGLGK